MTSVAIDWVSLGNREFVAWTRLAGVRLPFPLNTGAVGYGPAPAREEIERILAERELTGSPVLEATRAAFAQPRLSVYAVRVDPQGVETRYLSIAGRGDDAVLVLLDERRVAVRRIADTELAAGVVGALPPLRPMRFEPCEVSAVALEEIDRIATTGISPRTLRAHLAQAGFSEDLIAFRQRGAPGPTASGTLGAVGYAPDGGDAGTGSVDADETVLRHSPRSTNWREFNEGALLQVERGSRHGEQVVLLTPGTTDALFRSAVDAVASVFEAPN
jgi:DNA-binding transcriptional ArsR family regulator